MDVITDASRDRSGSLYEVYRSTDECYFPRSLKERKIKHWNGNGKHKFTFHPRRWNFGIAVQLTVAHRIVYSRTWAGYQRISNVNWSTREEFLNEVQQLKALVTPVQRVQQKYAECAIFGFHSAKHVECILEGDVTQSSKTLPSFRRKARPLSSGQKRYKEAVGSTKTLFNFYQTTIFTAQILH
jgi:hypothetical protein